MCVFVCSVLRCVSVGVWAKLWRKCFRRLSAIPARRCRQLRLGPTRQPKPADLLPAQPRHLSPATAATIREWRSSHNRAAAAGRCLRLNLRTSPRTAPAQDQPLRRKDPFGALGLRLGSTKICRGSELAKRATQTLASAPTEVEMLQYGCCGKTIFVNVLRESSTSWPLCVCWRVVLEGCVGGSAVSVMCSRRSRSRLQMLLWV